MNISTPSLLAGLTAGALLGSAVTGLILRSAADSPEGNPQTKSTEARKRHKPDPSGSASGKGNDISPRDASRAFNGWIADGESGEEYSRMLSLVSRAAEWSPQDTMDQALLIRNPYKRREALTRLFNYWIGSDREAALNAIRELDNPALQRDLYRSAMNWLSRDNPVAAIKILEKQPNLRDHELLARSYAIWAHKDRATAVESILAIENARMREHVLKSVANELAETNLKKALEWAGALSGGHQQTALEGVLGEAAGSDPVLAIKHLGRLPPGKARDAILGRAADEWAERDPSAAVKWADSLEDQGQRQLALGEIAESVLETDPDRAHRIIDMVPESPMREEIIQSIGRIRAAVGVDAAIEWVNALPPEDQAGAWGGVAREWAKIDPQAAAKYALETDQYDARRHLVASVSQSWSYIDPLEAAEWAQNLDEKAIAGAMNRIVENWSRQDPAAAGDYVANSLHGALQASMARQVASRWIRTDIVEAGAWIDDLPDGPARDGAVYTLVSSIERDYPEAALDWASTISDRKRREYTQRRIEKLLQNVR